MHCLLGVFARASYLFVSQLRPLQDIWWGQGKSWWKFKEGLTITRAQGPIWDSCRTAAGLRAAGSARLGLVRTMILESLVVVDGASKATWCLWSRPWRTEDREGCQGLTLSSLQTLNEENWKQRFRWELYGDKTSLGYSFQLPDGYDLLDLVTSLAISGQDLKPPLLTRGRGAHPTWGERTCWPSSLSFKLDKWLNN